MIKAGVPKVNICLMTYHNLSLSSTGIYLSTINIFCGLQHENLNITQFFHHNTLFKFSCFPKTLFVYNVT